MHALNTGNIIILYKYNIQKYNGSKHNDLKNSLFQHYHNLFIRRVLELTISHVLFTVKTLLFPEIYLWIHASLHPPAVELLARIGFLSGDRNDAKYALKIKYTHRNEEVWGLMTGYSLLVDQPVSNWNRLVMCATPSFGRVCEIRISS